MEKKKIGVIICTMIMLFAILIIGPLDAFSHGYFCDEIDYNGIAAEDFKGYVNLEDGDFEMKFSPCKRHFAGFEINLMNQPDSNTGNLILTVIDDNGKEIDNITVDLIDVYEGSWYMTYVNASLKKGEVYTLRFSAVDCASVPWLQVIDPDYLGEENISGNVLLKYAYAESTFTFQNKVLIVFFIVSVWGFLCSKFMENRKKIMQYASIFIFLTAVLSWNYMYNSMDSHNEDFSNFQEDSESLVTAMIKAERDGMGLIENGYGLGTYYHIEIDDASEGEWQHGYSKNEAVIRLLPGNVVREQAIIGNHVMFSNGDIFQIIDVNSDDSGMEITLDAGRVLSRGKYGYLSDISFLDSDMNILNKGIVSPYKSQYGLQGKIFKRIARYLSYREGYIKDLYLICAIALAAIFVVITFLISLKYNMVMAGVFFVTFWLSPWVVNFARNLYWVEFTWFFPMAAGLFCAWRINSRRCRIISYILAFIAILAKCLCGYEYISTIMMGLISFLLADFVSAMILKDKKKSRLLFQTIFMIGLTALSAFMAAICIHAFPKGEGNIVRGIKSIIINDVLRSTSGADFNMFGESYWPLFNASVWEVFCRYFHFSTEIITGVAGNLFPALCIVPLAILAYEYKRGRLNITYPSMYAIFFLTSVSWFCLAKSHSYEHPHMNYVLWYFGFVQICFYIILNRIIGIFSEYKGRENNTIL